MPVESIGDEMCYYSQLTKQTEGMAMCSGSNRDCTTLENASDGDTHALSIKTSISRLLQNSTASVCLLFTFYCGSRSLILVTCFIL